MRLGQVCNLQIHYSISNQLSLLFQFSLIKSVNKLFSEFFISIENNVGFLTNTTDVTMLRGFNYQKQQLEKN